MALRGDTAASRSVVDSELETFFQRLALRSRFDPDRTVDRLGGLALKPPALPCIRLSQRFRTQSFGLRLPVRRRADGRRSRKAHPSNAPDLLQHGLGSWFTRTSVA